VRADFEPILRQALEYLGRLGHRRIGYAGLTYIQRDPQFRCPRYQAFLHCVHGDERFEYHGEWGLNVRRFHHAAAAVDRLLETPPAGRPTAIIVRDGAWAMIHELHSRGLAIGRDISILSVSHVEPWSHWLRCCAALGERMPWLYASPAVAEDLQGRSDIFSQVVPTSVTWSGVAVGRAAVEEICRRWDDPANSPVDRMITSAQVDQGNTVGPAGLSGATDAR
jgi:hypothetical protein